MTLAFNTGRTRLNPGAHRATIQEIEAELVDAFPQSSTRRPIFESWLQVRESISRFTTVRKTIVDGSFVTSKRNPRDIDCVTVVSGSEFDGLNQNAQKALALIVQDPGFRQKTRCHSFLVFEYPPAHRSYPKYRESLEYWTNWFSSDRQGNPKGYIEVDP